MSNKVVIHIFHADESSVGTGAHVAERIRQVKEERGIALEVYVFGPAEKALGDPAHSEFRETLVKLAQAQVPVHVCRSIAEDMGKAGEFAGLGFSLEYARDAFARFATEGATVISF
jgi:hypothetical protein